jgi:hypothetical protein
MGEGLNRWLSNTRKLIDRARRGELPWTSVDPTEVLGNCRHCGQKVTRSDGMAFTPDHVVHVECKIAFDADKPRLIGIYGRWMEALEPLRLNESLPLRRRVTEVIRELPREFTLKDLKTSLDKIEKVTGPHIAIQHARAVLGDLRAVAN